MHLTQFSRSPANCSTERGWQNNRVTDRPEIGRIATLPMSVSRHLVSTSVQFGRSPARKTESDQWLLVAHLSSNLSSCRNLRCWLACGVGRPPPHDQGQNAFVRTNLEYMLRSVCRMQIRHIAIRGTFPSASTQTTPQTVSAAPAVTTECQLSDLRYLRSLWRWSKY